MNSTISESKVRHKFLVCYKTMTLATIILAFVITPAISASSATSISTEMTNHLYSPSCQPYRSATIIDRYNTNFTVTDSKGLREWRVGFIASDSIHGYYVESFFQENPNGTHDIAVNLFIHGKLSGKTFLLVSHGLGGLQVNRSIEAGDFVDFFLYVGILQVFWYQTNETIHNQQELVAVNVAMPRNFQITDEYQIFTPVPGAKFIKMTNFDVSVQASEISNIFPQIALRFSQTPPKCALGISLKVNSNLCFDTPVPIVNDNGRLVGVSERMLSSDIDT